MANGSILSLGTDARSQQRVLNEHANILAQMGGVLDAQADAIRGLGVNIDMLADTLAAFKRQQPQTFWQRLRWLVRGI